MENGRVSIFVTRPLCSHARSILCFQTPRKDECRSSRCPVIYYRADVTDADSLALLEHLCTRMRHAHCARAFRSRVSMSVLHYCYFRENDE